LISAIVMVARLDAMSLTGDEGFTAQMVKLPWSLMVSDLARIDYNMALHYLPLKAWTTIFGTSEASLRFPSVIAVLIALPLLYKVVTKIFDTRVAALAVIILALNPFFLRYGLTARPYGFLILWAVVATTTLVAALEDPTRRRWLVYGLVAVIGIHVHLTAVLVIAAHGLYAVYHQRRVTTANLGAVAVIVALGVIPTLRFLAPTDTLNWIDPFTIRAVTRTAYAVGGGFPTGWLILGLTAFGLIRPPQKAVARWLPAFWLVVPVAAYVALAPVQSMMIEDYFTGFAPAIAILAAIGFRRLISWKQLATLAFALAASGVALIISISSGGLDHSQNWRQLVPMMAGRVRPGEAVAFPNAFYRIVNMYYSADPLKGPFPPGDPVLPSSGWGTLRPYELDFIKRTGIQADHVVFEPAALAWEHIWVVGTGDEFDTAVVEDLIDHGYSQTESVSSDGVVARLFIVDHSHDDKDPHTQPEG
jgi:mannosyltransferase